MTDIYIACASDGCYFEGNSPKLGSTDEGPSTFFMFETQTLAEGRYLLNRDLGFTANEIMAVAVFDERG